MAKKSVNQPDATRKDSSLEDVHWVSTFETANPETFHQLCINIALDEMGREYGAVINDCSEQVAEIIINAAATAAQAALAAAGIPDDWRHLIKPKISKRQKHDQLVKVIIALIDAMEARS